MTRLAPALARRIDRLARHAHAFHRFAHHPLCSNYGGELVSLGHRRRVCRGCACAVLGAAAGVALGATLQGGVVASALAAALSSSLLALSLRARLPKSVGRLAPAALCAYALVALLREGGSASVCALGALPLALFAAREVYRRRGPNRDACHSCPERARLPRCSGFSRIVLRERAFQRLAQRWIDAARA